MTLQVDGPSVSSGTFRARDGLGKLGESGLAVALMIRTEFWGMFCYGYMGGPYRHAVTIVY